MLLSGEIRGPVTRPRWFFLSRFDVVRIVLGAVLVTAAALKGYTVGSAPILWGALLNNPVFLLALIEWELFLGLWLLVGFRPRILRPVALVWFVMLLGVSLSQAASGVRSCACFGFVEVTPWLTAGFDLAAVAALWLVRPQSVTPPLCEYLYTSAFFHWIYRFLSADFHFQRPCHLAWPKHRTAIGAVGLHD